MINISINWANRIYIGIACCLLVFAIFNVINYQTWSRYYYGATAIAPALYPVSVRECNFTTADNNDDVFVGTEDINKFNTTWDSGGDFLQLRDKRLLPEKLNISYFSYRDRKFYKGSFNLPTKRIEQIFKLAIRNKKTEKLYSYGGQLKGLTFIIGIANNGNILVWMRGIYLEVLIFKGKVKIDQPSAVDLYYPEPPTKALDYEEEFKNVSDSLKFLIKRGYDSSANYADSSTHYIENNSKLWSYQQKNGYIDYGK